MRLQRLYIDIMMALYEPHNNITLKISMGYIGVAKSLEKVYRG